MILAAPAVSSLAGAVGPPIDRKLPPNAITVIALTSDRVSTSYSPPADFAGYHFRHLASPGLPWERGTDVDRSGLRASGYVLLADLPASAVEVMVKPRDADGLEGDPEARVLLGSAPPTGIALAPDWMLAWALQKTDAGAGVTQHGGDAELHGGTAGDNVTDRAAALWSRQMFAPPFLARFAYDPGVDPSPTPLGGEFFQIALARALGADPNVANLPGATTPRDLTYGVLLNGVRASIDTNGFSGNGSNQIRLRAYTGAGVTGDLHITGVQKTVAFPRGQASVVEVDVPGDDTLSVKVTFTDGSSVTQGFQDAAIRTWLGSDPVNVGLLAWAGRSAKLSAASEAPIVVTPPGGNEGLAAPFSAPATSLNIIPATAANFSTQYAKAGPGDTVLVPPGFSYPGGFTFGRSGSLGASTDAKRPERPIVVRVGTLAADGKTVVDPPSFPAATITGQATFSGNYNWLRGFSVGGYSFSVGARGNRLNRCRLTAQGGDAGTDTSIDWCEWPGGYSGVFHHVLPWEGARDPLVYRCHLHHDVGTVAPNRTFLMVGYNNKSTAISCRAVVRDCLFSDNGGGIQQAVEFKCSDSVAERCTAISAGPSDHLRFNGRHGQRNAFKACYGDLGQIEVRGPDHLLADCRLGGNDFVGPASGNCTYDEWLAFAANGKQDGKYPSADDCRVVRCDNVGVGDSTAGTGVVPVGTQLWNIVGAATMIHGATVAPQDVHGGDPSDVPSRSDSGYVPWTSSQVGPNGKWKPADGGT